MGREEDEDERDDEGIVLTYVPLHKRLGKDEDVIRKSLRKTAKK